MSKGTEPEATPLYQRIAAWLEAQIVSGALEMGDRVPSERRIGEALGASRMTARQALKFLERRGLVETRTGRGVFVTRTGARLRGTAPTGRGPDEATMTDTPTAAAYLAQLADRVGALMQANSASIAAAADAVERSAKADGLVYIFGTGHSHMLAEEAFYRAGGLALTVPILSGTTMLHEGAVAGTVFERIPGMVAPIFARYPIGPNDTLFVVSNSGVNAAPVEAAEIGKARGAVVVAITSDAYSREAAKGRKRLAEVADIVLDNGAPSGDAIVAVAGSALKVGPVSTSIGAALLNAVLAEAAARLQSSGAGAPIFLSANMPGAADVNKDLVARYRPRNPHL